MSNTVTIGNQPGKGVGKFPEIAEGMMFKIVK